MPVGWAKDFYTKQIARGIRYRRDQSPSDAQERFRVYVDATSTASVSARTSSNERSSAGRSWLEPHGMLLVDEQAPWYWSAKAGSSYSFGGLEGLFSFDAEKCRMVAEAWPAGDERQRTAQTIRCYSPSDLELLLEGTGLVLAGYEPYDNEDYDNAVPLIDAMLYLAKVAVQTP